MADMRKYQKDTPGSKTIIVTGASAGLGYAIAKYLINEHQHGHHVVIVTGRNEKPLRELQALETQNGGPKGRVCVFVGDMSDLKTASGLIEAVKSVSDKLDGVVLNHGIIGENKRIVDCDPEEWDKVNRVNVISLVAVIKLAIPLLRESHGRIILTSSGMATGAMTTMGAYGASKAVVNHLAGTLKVEEPLITTVSVRPGKVDTGMQTALRGGMTRDMEENEKKVFLDAPHDGSLVKPEQPGNVMARLVLAAPKELNGQYLTWSDKKLEEFQD